MARLDRNGQDEASVSIRLVPGLPTSLRKRTIEDKFRRAMLLAPLGPDLKRLKHGANRVGKFLDNLPIEAQVGGGAYECRKVSAWRRRICGISAP